MLRAVHVASENCSLFVAIDRQCGGMRWLISQNAHLPLHGLFTYTQTRGKQEQARARPLVCVSVVLYGQFADHNGIYTYTHTHTQTHTNSRTESHRAAKKTQPYETRYDTY